MTDFTDSQPREVTVSWDDLKVRIAAKREVIDRLKREIVIHEEELGGLQAAERLLFGGGLTPATQSGDQLQRVGRVSLAKSPRQRPKITHKYQTLAVLAEAPEDGLLAVEIIAGAAARFPLEASIERTSISPLLAKMAKPEAGPLVAHEKGTSRWSITDAGRRELASLKGAVR